MDVLKINDDDDDPKNMFNKFLQCQCIESCSGKQHRYSRGSCSSVAASIHNGTTKGELSTYHARISEGKLKSKLVL